VSFGPSTTIKCLCGAAGIGLGTTIKFLRRSTSGAAGNGFWTTTKYLRGAASIGLGTTANYLRRTASAAAGNGLGTTIKYLVNRNAGAGNNWAKAHYTAAGYEFCLIFLLCSDFCIKLRAPHRGTSLGPFVCGARAFLLCS
jgi:hypothetical protein